MSKRLFVMKPWFWVAVGAMVVFMLTGYLYALVVEGIRPVVVFEIDSEPSGAFVYFNDDILGRTPHKHEVEGRLSGELKLISEGYKDIERQIEIEPGKTVSLKFHLKKDTKLVVNSKPQGANLFIDDVLWGSTPCTLEGHIDVGNHIVRVEMLERCYGEVSKDIELVSGEELVVNADELVLPKLNTITINSQPQGAIVASDGEEWGMTPLTKCLAAGDYKITFTKENFATEEKQFELSSDASIYVKMLDPESYKKRNHFEVDASVEAIVRVIPRKADSYAPIYGTAYKMGVTPTSLVADELMENTKITTKPFSYIVTASAKGYEPGITEMTEPGLTYFDLKELPASSKSYQGKYSSYSSTSIKPNGLISPDSRYEIKADKNSATLKDVRTEKSYSLYVESDYKNNEFTWSDDSKWLWYFRNNEGIRELIKFDVQTEEFEVIDSFDLTEFNASVIIPDNIFGCITSIEYSKPYAKLYYLVPGTKNSQLSLVSNSLVGDNRSIIEKNIVPVIDKWSLWLESKNVLKFTGYFPGLIKHDGYYMLDQQESVHFAITTNPDPIVKVGQLKQINTGMTMFPSAALVKKKNKDVIISAQLYKGLSVIFIYHSTSDEYELMDIIIR